MKCPKCGLEASFLKQYQRHYCYHCKEYLSAGPTTLDGLDGAEFEEPSGKPGFEKPKKMASFLIPIGVLGVIVIIVLVLIPYLNPPKEERNDTYYWGVANVTMDYAHCDSISVANTKALCYGMIAYGENDPSICELLSMSKEKCYAAGGAHLKNDSWCEFLNYSLSLMDYCYQKVGRHTGEATCNKITDDNKKDLCFYELTMESLNSTYCVKIKGAYKNSCYVDLAIETRDGSHCDGIDLQVWKDECYKDLAVATNSTFCAKIVDTKKQETCYNIAS